MAVTAVAALALVGCAPHSEVVEGTSVRVAVSQPLTSLNPLTSFGGVSDANEAIYRATHSSFVAYDARPELVPDESLGSYEVVSDDPLTVTYTLERDIRWSDGVPIDAADLLLAWVANSGALNDPDVESDEFVDPQTGRFTDEFPRDVVYFDGFSGNGLQLVTQTPVVGADGRSITLTFDEYFADFELIFDLGLPAHVVAAHALGIDDDTDDADARAKDALTEAIVDNDRPALAAISRFWNSGYNLDEDAPDEDAGGAADGTDEGGGDEASLDESAAEQGPAPIDPTLLVSSGPYQLTEVVPGVSATLSVNPEYRGDHLPHYERVIVSFISDPLQMVAALEEGAVDVIAPQATQDVLAALDELSDVTVEHGFSGRWEKLELQQANSRTGHVENELVRRAFLKTVPRDQIVDELIGPLDPQAQPRDSHVFLPGTDEYEAAVASNGSRAYSRVDIAGAKRLLARAGEQKAALATPTICLLFDPANPRRVAEFTLIQSSAEEAGIRVTNCASPDWRNLLGTPGSYDAALYALDETNRSVAAVEASYASDSALNNHSWYASEAADALIATAAGPASATERIRSLTQLDRLLWRDAVGMPLYQFPTVTAVRDGVLGVTRSPFEPTALWNPWSWEPELDAE